MENANKVHRPPTNAMSDQKCPKKALGRGIRTSLSEYFLERGIIISLFVSAARDAPTMQLVPGLRIARAKVKWVQYLYGREVQSCRAVNHRLFNNYLNV